MKKLKVKTKNNSYEILIKKGLLDDVSLHLPPSGKMFLITNDNLAEIYSDFVFKFKNRVIIKDGEINKNFETYQFIVESLLSKKIERKDTVIAFGGGVTGDLAGFAASSVLRGVNLVQVPSTLLAQVDSSIGGKTGFNTRFGKNLVGAFYQPKSVLIDLNLLNTLDKKQLKTGLGEVVKYAFIEKNCSKDKKFYLFDRLFSNGEIDYSEIVYRSAGLKASVVSADEKEKGLRMVLNFGHTFAHSIETITGYLEFTHGEAVGMGMKSAFELSYNLGIIDKSYYIKGFELIDKFELAPSYKLDWDKKKFIEIMKSDKKVASSKIRLVLPVKKGLVKVYDDIGEDEILKVI